MAINTYIIANETGRAVIVDPGFEVDKIFAKLEKHNLLVDAILLTHGHFDHICHIDVLREKTGAEVWLHSEEVPVITCVEANGSKAYCEEPYTVKADKFFGEGTYKFGGIGIQIIHTPGHTAGSCCFLVKKVNTLITGDTLFNGGIGRSDFATGNNEQLIKSIKTKILTMPGDTIVLPGHGMKTNVGLEAETNPYL